MEKTSFEKYLNSDIHLLCMTGKTGSGKTKSLFHYFEKNKEMKTMFLLPKRTSLIHTKEKENENFTCMSVQHFCKKYIISNIYQNMNIDVLILDEFHVENPEKYMILQCIKKKWFKMKKIIVVSATMSDYDYSLLEICMNQSKEEFYHLEIPSTTHYTIEIEYKSIFGNSHTNNNWSFNSYYQISYYDMCFVIQELLNNENINQNILIFVQSPDICEKIYENLKEK